MSLLVIIVILILCSGGIGYYGGPVYSGFGYGGFGSLIIVLLILWAMGLLR